MPAAALAEVKDIPTGATTSRPARFTPQQRAGIEMAFARGGRVIGLQARRTVEEP